MSVVKALRTIERRQEHQRGERSNSGDGLQPSRLWVRLGALAKLLIQRPDLLVERRQHRNQWRKLHPQLRGQL